MPGSRHWTVTTNGERPLQEIQKELAKRGLAIEQVLDAIGIIRGAASEEVADEIRRIRGIEDVSPESHDTDIDIGRPGSDLTW